MINWVKIKIPFSPIPTNTRILIFGAPTTMKAHFKIFLTTAVSKFMFGLYKPKLHAYIRSPQSTKKYYRTGRKKLWRLFMMKGWADNNFEK